MICYIQFGSVNEITRVHTIPFFHSDVNFVHVEKFLRDIQLVDVNFINHGTDHDSKRNRFQTYRYQFWQTRLKDRNWNKLWSLVPWLFVPAHLFHWNVAYPCCLFSRTKLSLIVSCCNIGRFFLEPPPPCNVGAKVFREYPLPYHV